MRIVVITTSVNPVVQSLVDDWSHQVVGVVESASRFSFSKLKFFSAFKKIPYFKLFTENQNEFESWLRSLRPDLLVIYSMKHLLPEKILKIPLKGAMNIHPSLLPQFRGPAPLLWQAMTLAPDLGFSIHEVEAEEDSGAILFQEKFSLNAFESLESAWKRILRERIPEVLKKILKQIQSGTVEKFPQISDSKFLRARRMNRREIAHFIDASSKPRNQVREIITRSGFSPFDLWPEDFGAMDYREWELLSQDLIQESRQLKKFKCADGALYFKRRFSFRTLIKSLRLKLDEHFRA